MTVAAGRPERLAGPERPSAGRGRGALDPDALRYERYWQPVLAPAAKRLLERIAEPPAVFLDVGAGTGGLIVAAAARWPRARLLAVDASAAMLALARRRVDGLDDDPARFGWIAADAADLPLEGGSVDAATCSFVLPGLGGSRALLREVRRVLRPGGVFACVTWLADPSVIPADEPYERALAELGHALAPTDPAASDGDGYGTVDELRRELRAAGLEAVEGWSEELRQRWTAAAYLEFKAGYDDHERLDALAASEWVRVRAAVRAAWADLPAGAFELRAPLAAGLARVPGSAAVRT